MGVYWSRATLFFARNHVQSRDFVHDACGVPNWQSVCLTQIGLQLDDWAAKNGSDWPNIVVRSRGVFERVGATFEGQLSAKYNRLSCLSVAIFAGWRVGRQSEKERTGNNLTRLPLQSHEYSTADTNFFIVFYE